MNPARISASQKGFVQYIVLGLLLVLAAGAILFSIFGLLPEALGDRPYNAFGKDSRAHHRASAQRT